LKERTNKSIGRISVKEAARKRSEINSLLF
jgi:hypothetical protein